MTRASHLHALENAQRVAGHKLAVFNEINTECPGSRACRGIFIKLPRQHAPGECFAISAERKAVCHRGVLALQSAKFWHVHGDVTQRGAIAQRHHQVEDARGNKFRLQLRVEIFRRDPQGGGKPLLVDFRWFEDRFFLGHGHALRAAVLETDLHGQDACARLLQNVHAAVLRGNNTQLREQEPGAGHPVIGTWFLLAELGVVPAQDGGVHILQETGAGVLPVEIRFKDGRPQRATITQKEASFKPAKINKKKLASALGISPKDFDPKLQPEFVSTGIFNLMVPLRNRAALGKIAMNMAELRRLQGKNATMAYCFALGGNGKAFSRGMLPWELY